jgi:hypothetical protein
MVIAETRGQLIVENPTGVALSLRIDGQDRGSLAAGETRSFRLDQGSHRVEASYEVLGRKLELEDRGVRIEAEERRRVRLEAPSFGLVQVQNRTGRTATLYIDGERHHMMDSGDISVLELPLGTARVSLKIRQRVVDQGQVDVKPFRAAVFEGEPATATLELDSDIPVRGEVYVDSMRVGNLDAHGRMRLSLRPGTHRLQVRDPAGRLLLDRRIQVDIFDTVRLRVQNASLANSSGTSGHIRPGSGPSGAVYVVD